MENEDPGNYGNIFSRTVSIFNKYYISNFSKKRLDIVINLQLGTYPLVPLCVLHTSYTNKNSAIIITENAVVSNNRLHTIVPLDNYFWCNTDNSKLFLARNLIDDGNLISPNDSIRVFEVI